MTNSIITPKALTITAAEFTTKNKFELVEEVEEAQLVEVKNNQEDAVMTFKEAEEAAAAAVTTEEAEVTSEDETTEEAEVTTEEETAAEAVAPVYQDDVVEMVGLTSIRVITDSKNGYKVLLDEVRLSRMKDHCLTTYGKDALSFFTDKLNSKISEAMLSSNVLLNHLAEIVCNYAIYKLSRLAIKGTNHETEFKPILEEDIKNAYVNAIEKETNTKISEEDIVAAMSVYKESIMEVVYAVFQEKYNRSIFGCADF